MSVSDNRFRRLHSSLDDELRQELKLRFPDDTKVKHLKREKLRAKDRIAMTA